MATFATDKIVSTWAKTHSCLPKSYYEPTTLAEIQSIVRTCANDGRVIRVVGSAHSPNDCVMNDDVILSLRKYNKVLLLDVENALVKIQAGITLHELNEALANVGLAMPSLGSISDQTLAGAIATGTHGSGAKYGPISSTVTELQLVMADGSITVCSAKDNSGNCAWLGVSSTYQCLFLGLADLFHAALCSFGCLGIVVGMVLKVVPAFDLRAIENPNKLSSVLRHLEENVASAPFYR